MTFPPASGSHYHYMKFDMLKTDTVGKANGKETWRLHNPGLLNLTGDMMTCKCRYYAKRTN